MSHFYGVLQGSRGEATRCGTKGSGMETIAASWNGAIRTTLYIKDGEDYARVEKIRWHGNGVSQVLYDGPVGGADGS
jgi:hypothetical protein